MILPTHVCDTYKQNEYKFFCDIDNYNDSEIYRYLRTKYNGNDYISTNTNTISQVKNEKKFVSDVHMGLFIGMTLGSLLVVSLIGVGFTHFYKDSF